MSLEDLYRQLKERTGIDEFYSFWKHFDIITLDGDFTPDQLLKIISAFHEYKAAEKAIEADRGDRQ